MHAAASTAGKRRLTRRERAGECERRIPSDKARIEEGIRFPYRSTADAGRQLRVRYGRYSPPPRAASRLLPDKFVVSPPPCSFANHPSRQPIVVSVRHSAADASPVFTTK